MRRIHALLATAGLMAAPISAVAGPNSTAPNKPDDRSETFTWSMSTSRARLGVMVVGLTPELRAHFGAPKSKGVMVARVSPGSAAEKAGLEVGDILTDVKGIEVDDASDVLSALASAKKGDTASIAVIRDHKPEVLSVQMQDDPSPMPTMRGFPRGFSPPDFERWFQQGWPDDWPSPWQHRQHDQHWKHGQGQKPDANKT